MHMDCNYKCITANTIFDKFTTIQWFSLIIIIIIIIICYIYIALFWVLKALYIEGGESPQPPPVCSIHLDDATAAIVRQNDHHTPAYWWRRERVMKPIVWGLLGDHDGQRPMGEFSQDAGVKPLLFFKWHPGIFNDHRESGPRFNVSSEGRCFFTVLCPRHYTGALGPTQTTVWAPPAGLTNTSSSSNLVFPGGLPSRYWPAQPCLASVGNQSWAARWYSCWQWHYNLHYVTDAAQFKLHLALNRGQK